MSKDIFTPMEIDAIGEIMNISLGSSATAISNMLDHRVDITTPKVAVVDAQDFSIEKLEPAIGVEIQYVTGLEGSNIMILKMSDVKAITDILMGMETPDEEFELNDLTLSAVCEVMNQMMGAASTALSDFLGRMVNISTPQTFDANNLDEVKQARLPVKSGPIVVVQFALLIEDAVESEFMNVISVDLAKELVSGFGLGDDGGQEEPVQEAPAPAAPAAPPPQASSGGTLSQEEIERLMGGGAAAPAPGAGGGGTLSQEEVERMMGGGGAAAPAPGAGGGGTLSQEEIERMMGGGAAAPQSAPPPPQAAQPGPGASGPGGMPPGAGAGGMPPQAGYPPYYGWPPAPGPDGQQMPYYPPMGYWPPTPSAPPSAPPAAKQKVIQTKSVPMPRLENGEELGEEQAQNLDLIMSVPLEVAVEIGRTRKKVQDILALSKGSLVVLDKLAGDQVDVYVNGKCIAHGDVVVVDDNFGIRINEIVRKPDLEDLK